MERLDEFLMEQQKLIIEFQKYWREMHNKDGEKYPAILDHDNWVENFKDFEELKG